MRSLFELFDDEPHPVGSFVHSVSEDQRYYVWEVIKYNFDCSEVYLQCRYEVLPDTRVFPYTAVCYVWTYSRAYEAVNEPVVTNF
jgi:hypothetical protein